MTLRIWTRSLFCTKKLECCPRELIWTMDDTIRFEEVTSTLYRSGHPDHTESLNSPTTYRQLRVKWRGPRPDYPTGGLTGSSMVEKLIGNIASEVLKAFPPVCWVVKCSRMLCDRLSQASHFKTNEQYRQLVSLSNSVARERKKSYSPCRMPVRTMVWEF